MYHRPGPKLKGYMDQHSSDDPSAVRVIRAKSNLLHELCQSLQTRFSDMTTSLLQATKLADLNSWRDVQYSDGMKFAITK